MKGKVVKNPEQQPGFEPGNPWIQDHDASSYATKKPIKLFGVDIAMETFFLKGLTKYYNYLLEI